MAMQVADNSTGFGRLSIGRTFWIIVNMIPIIMSAIVFAWAQQVELLWLVLVLSVAIVIVFHLMEIPMMSLLTWFTLSYGALFYLHPLLFALSSRSLAERPSFVPYVFLTVVSIHLFLIGYLVTRDYRYSLLVFPRPIMIRRQRLIISVWILLGIGYIGLLLKVVSFGSLSVALGASRIALQQGPFSLISEYLFLFFSPAFFLFPTYARQRGGFGALLMLIGLLVAEVFLFYFTRIRTYPVAHALASMAGLYFSHYVASPEGVRPHFAGRLRRLERRYSVRFILVMVIVAMAAMNLRFIRGYLEPGAAPSGELSMWTAVTLSLQHGDLGYTETVLDVLEYVPQHHKFLYGQSYWRVLLVPIPRMIYPQKPPNTQQIVGSWFVPEVKIQTIPPGITGDAYINFGFAGILMFPLFGMLFGRIDRVTELTSFMLVGTSFVQIFHFVRGGFTNPLLQFLFLVGISSLVGRWVVGREKNNPLTPNSLGKGFDS